MTGLISIAKSETAQSLISYFAYAKVFGKAY